MKRRVVILSVVAMASGAWLGAAGPIAGAGGADYHLYFGDLRNHTRFSDGWDGTPKDAFDHARASGADWLWTSDHNFMLTQDE